MRKVNLIFLLLMMIGSLSAVAEECKAWVSQAPEMFNPANTWEYNKMFQSVGTESNRYDMTSLEMKTDGTESREGKEYHRMMLGEKGEDTGNRACYLLREDNGAYHIYLEYPGDVTDSNGEASVPCGDYLVYDFNMEVGDSFEAPTLEMFDNRPVPGIDSSDVCMMNFVVKRKSTDESGRRELVLSCSGGNQANERTVRVVEGVGFVENGNLAMSIWDIPTTGWRVGPFLMFDELVDEEGDVIYLSPLEREAGFVRERDYAWIYGIYDAEGEVTYAKCGFDYLFPTGFEDGEKIYRRFGTYSISDTLDGEWENTKFSTRYVRESDGKVYLRHLVEGEDGSGSTVEESLIYDFNAPDASELTIYTPEGDKTVTISTGKTEVDGNEVRSYTFDGSDGVKCVEGLGIVKGGILPCVNTEFKLPTSAEDKSYCGAVLVAVYDGEGNLIYSQDLPGGIEAISTDADGYRSPETRIYDLQGRELTAPVPGQPYIKGGKVLVEGGR